MFAQIRRWFSRPRSIAIRVGRDNGVEAFSMFDRVAVRANREPEAAHLAGRQGIVYGETTPTVSGVPVIGVSAYDYAVCVCLDGDANEPAWYSAELLEFIERGAGTSVGIGGKTYTLRADGGWDGPK